MKEDLFTYFFSYPSIIQNTISIVLMCATLGIVVFVIYLERKFAKISANLSYREEMFNTLCSNVSEVFVIFDRKNVRYEYISPNFEGILGIHVKEMYKDNYVMFKYIFSDNKDEIWKYLQKDFSEKFEFETAYNHPVTHRKMWLLITLQPVFVKNSLDRYVCSILDITSKIEGELEIKEALSHVRRANEAKKDFLSHMSHELKTPINAIIGMTQIAARSKKNEDKVEYCLDKINYASNQLLTLINTILDIAKADNDKLLLNKEPFSLSQMITTLSTMYKAQAELNNINYHMILSGIQDDIIIGDSLKLGQIIMNCLSNSFKFTSVDGYITLEVSEEEKRGNKALYRFLISDTGKGMNENFIDRLFLPFHQEDNSIYQKYGGTGLGMSIAKDLVHLMGGNIKVSSKIDIGTQICIDIVFEATEAEPEQTETKPWAKDPLNYDFSGIRILVVEDNEINLEITREFLKIVNVTVEEVTSGYQAVERFLTAEAGYYDAVLMDVQMLGFNGYEATKAIRCSVHPDAKKIVIIALTADDSEDCIMTCADSEMNYHITKPIELKILYSLLDSIFKQNQN